MCALTEDATPADILDRCRCMASFLVEALGEGGGFDGSTTLSPRAANGLCLILLDMDAALAEAAERL